MIAHACLAEPPRPCQMQPTNFCGSGRGTRGGCNIPRRNYSGLQGTACSLYWEETGGHGARCSSDAMSFDITIGATRITHSQGYPSTKSELKAAETLINGLATLLNQSLKSSTPEMDESSPPTTSCPSLPREQERATPLSPRCVCSSSKSPKGEESAVEPDKVDQDVDEPSKKPDPGGGLSNVPPRKLACPFYQHDPDGHFRKEYCTDSGFSNADEVRSA